MENRKISISDWVELSKSGASFSAEITLNGLSMLPLIRQNSDTVVICPVNRKFKTGDIVLAEIDGIYAVHRIVSISGDTVTTLGDNCLNCDKPIKKEKVLGIVTEIHRNGRIIKTESFSVSLLGKAVKCFLPIRRFFRFSLLKAAKLKNKLLKRQ